MTLFPFVPNVQAPFAFQPVLDNQGYSATVTWNLFAQRWYVNVNQLTGELVFSLPLLGSPDGVGIDSVTWAFGKVTVVTELPHGFTVGQTVEATITGCSPDEYNGVMLAFVVNPLTLQFRLVANPGDATQLGNVIYNVNLAAGYFTTSTMVFRESSQTFEVTP